MATYKIIRFGDEQGVGAIVEEKRLFRKPTTWTVVPYRNDISTFDKWVCLQTGATHFRGSWDGCYFYGAQFNTK